MQRNGNEMKTYLNIVIWLTLAALPVSAVGQAFLPQIELGKFFEFETESIVAIKSATSHTQSYKKTTLEISDIAGSKYGEDWIATQQGLFRKSGYGWAREDGFPGVPEKIEIGASGNLYVVSTVGDLSMRVFDDSSNVTRWIKLFSDIKDIGVGGTPEHGDELFALRKRDSKKNTEKNSVEVIQVRNIEDIGDSELADARFWTVQAEDGTPTSIDVSSYGKAYLGTVEGDILQIDPDAGAARLTVISVDRNQCDTVELACDQARTITDLTILGDNRQDEVTLLPLMWITGTASDGEYTALYSGGMSLGPSSMIKLMDEEMTAVGSRANGSLLAVRKSDGKPGVANLNLKYQKDGNFFGILANTAFAYPTAETMTLFNRDSGFVLDVPQDSTGSVDLPALLDFESGFTITFAAQLNSETENGCLFSLKDLINEYLSVCVDTDRSLMIVSLGNDVSEFQFDKSLPQLFVLAGSESTGTLYSWEKTFDISRGVDDAIQTSLTTLGDFDIPFNATKEDIVGELQLSVGSRDGISDNYHGHLGAIRFWSVSLDPEKTSVVYPFEKPMTISYPAFNQLLVEALLGPEHANDLPASVRFLPAWRSLAPFWYAPTTQAYDAITETKGFFPFKYNKPEAFRIVQLPPASDLQPPRLAIYRKGEGDDVTSFFEQDTETSYKGWTDPRTGLITLQPVTLDIIDESTIIVRYNPGLYGLGKEVDYKLVPVRAFAGQEQLLPIKPPAVSDSKTDAADSFTFESMGRSKENFLGFDIREMSPYSVSSNKSFIFKTIEIGNEATTEYSNQNRVNLPWGVLHGIIDQSAAMRNSTMVETTVEAHEGWSAGLGISADIAKLAAFKANVDFEKSITEMSRDQTAKIIGDIWWASYVLVTDTARSRLHDQFVKDLDLVSKGELNVSNLIDTYGTHYAEHVVYGSKAQYEEHITESEIKNIVESKWNVALEQKAQIKAVKLELEQNFGKEDRNEAGRISEEKKLRMRTSAGNTGFDPESVTQGEDVTRVLPITVGLRPIADLLSPFYFPDRPDIYNDLRWKLSLKINESLGEVKTIEGLSNVSLIPDVYMLSIETMAAKSLGDDATVYGEISIVGEQEALWKKSKQDPLTASAAQDGKWNIDTREVITLYSHKESLFDKKLKFDLKSTTSQKELNELEINLADYFVLPGETRVGNIQITANCSCKTECEAGYMSYEGQCLKSCPEGNQWSEDGSLCNGVVKSKFYTWFEKQDCNNDWEDITGGCDLHDLGYYPKCPDNYTRQSVGGVCVPQCEKFGLEKNIGRTVLDSAVLLKTGLTMRCNRPVGSGLESAGNTNDGKQCRVGSVPSDSCPTVTVQISLTRLPRN